MTWCRPLKDVVPGARPRPATQQTVNGRCAGTLSRRATIFPNVFRSSSDFIETVNHTESRRYNICAVAAIGSDICLRVRGERAGCCATPAPSQTLHDAG